MSYILFVDESGQDHQNSPYEVLAGIAVKDTELWKLISKIRQLELDYFGRHYSGGTRELKAKKLLKTKTFRLAHQIPSLGAEKRRDLAKKCLESGPQASQEMLSALSQAKIEFVRELLVTCLEFNCRAFASVVPWNAPLPTNRSFLRKDYAYFFERFYYFLEDMDPAAQGLVVFDELEKSKSHILINQMRQYFDNTTKGFERSFQIIPEPFFVHSELTTGIQIADLIAYIISWGIRLNKASAPPRAELKELSELVMQLRYRAIREREGNPNFVIWSFAQIDDLRPSKERA